MDLEKNQSEVLENENEVSYEGLLDNQKNSFKRKIVSALGVFAVVAGLHVSDGIKDSVNSGNEDEMSQEDRISFIESQRAEASTNTRRAKIVKAIQIEE